MSQSLADQLRTARKKKRLSQREAARRIGVHHMQISKYERGVNVPGGLVLQRMAEVYEYPVGELLASGAAPEVSENAQASAQSAVTPPAELSDFARGVLHAARQMSQTVTALIDEVMRGPTAPPPAAAPRELPKIEYQPIERAAAAAKRQAS